MNHMDKYNDSEECNILFSKIFKILIRDVDKDLNKKVLPIDLIDKYKKSNFRRETFFTDVRDKFISLDELNYF